MEIQNCTVSRDIGIALTPPT